MVFHWNDIDAEYGTPTTPALPRRLLIRFAALMPDIGKSRRVDGRKRSDDVGYKMETLEHFCSIILYARQLGGEKFLDDSEANKLFTIRKEVYGKELPSCTGCGFCDSINGGDRQTKSAPLDNIPSDEVLKEQIIRQTIEEVVRQVMANT